MEGAKKEGSNHQVIELARFISNSGIKNPQFCAARAAGDRKLQACDEK
jgi:hypothetical protein